MGAHKGSAAVQEWGCRALANLGRNCPSRKELITQAGAIPAAKAAAKTHEGTRAAGEALDLLRILT